MLHALYKWRTIYLTPVAPLYLALTIGGTALFAWAYIVRSLEVGLVAVIMMVAPFAVGLLAALFRRPKDHVMYFGWINSYRLSNRELTFMVGRTLPIFRVSLAEVKSVQPWRGLAPASHGSNEWRSWWFLTSQIWFWPTPIHFLIKKMTAAQSLKCEYSLACDSGWIIVITCPRDFISRVAHHAERARSPNNRPTET